MSWFEFIRIVFSLVIIMSTSIIYSYSKDKILLMIMFTFILFFITDIYFLI